jgi:hypothetical protein
MCPCAAVFGGATFLHFASTVTTEIHVPMCHVFLERQLFDTELDSTCVTSYLPVFYYTDPSGVGWKVKIISDKIYTCITSHVPVFYYTDPSGVGWALPLFTSL